MAGDSIATGLATSLGRRDGNVTGFSATAAEAAAKSLGVLLGGQIKPDLPRINADALELIRGFYGAGKIVAAVCHAPWLLIESGIAKGKSMTSYHSMKTDVINAGAKWRTCR